MNMTLIQLPNIIFLSFMSRQQSDIDLTSLRAATDYTRGNSEAGVLQLSLCASCRGMTAMTPYGVVYRSSDVNLFVDIRYCQKVYLPKST
jgi:hypothetical protein